MFGTIKQSSFHRQLKKLIKKSSYIREDFYALMNYFQFQFDHHRKNCKELCMKTQSLSASLKLYILVHSLINRYLMTTQPYSDLLEILSLIRYQPKGDFEILLDKKLLQPYKLYLQKRLTFRINHKQIYLNSNQSQMYQYFNLLKVGSAFIQVIYLFGRYFMGQYGYAVHFNICLGKDLKDLYHSFVSLIPRPAPMHILEEIQSLHEKMYMVYYNCYFYGELRSYVPTWVLTDYPHLDAKRPHTPQKDLRDTAKSTVTSKLRSSSLMNTRTSLTGTKSSKKTPHNLKSTIKKKEKPLEQSHIFLNQLNQEAVEEQQSYQQKPSVQVSNFDSCVKKEVQHKKDNLDDHFNLLKSMERWRDRYC